MTPAADIPAYLKHALRKVTAAATVPIQCFALLTWLVNASKGHGRQATWHSQRFIAGELGVSPATVGRWARHLVALGLLELTVHKAYPDPDTGQFTRLCSLYRPRWATTLKEAMRAALDAKRQVAPKTADGSSTPLSGGRTRRTGRWRGSKTPAPPAPTPDCPYCEGLGWTEGPDHRWERCRCTNQS